MIHYFIDRYSLHEKMRSLKSQLSKYKENICSFIRIKCWTLRRSCVYLSFVFDAGVKNNVVDSADLRPVVGPQQRAVVLGLEEESPEPAVTTYPAGIERSVVHRKVALHDGAFRLALPVHRREEVFRICLEDDSLKSGCAERGYEDGDDDEVARILADGPAELPE